MKKNYYTVGVVAERFSASKHRDSGNAGPSAVVAFGKFRGGRLLYWPDDDKSEPVSKLRNDQAERHTVKHRIHLFDANRAHSVEPFKGKRSSLVAFASKDSWDAPAEIREEAMALGVPLPKGPKGVFS